MSGVEQSTLRLHRYGELGLAAVIAIALALLWGYPLLALDRLFVNVDLLTHYRWASQFIDAIDQGILIPRWMPLSHLGLGDPTFLYYSPLFYYVVWGFHLIFGDVWVALKVAAVAGNALSGFVAFCALRRWMCWRLAATGALVLQLSPVTFFLGYSHNAFPWQFAQAWVIWLLAASFEGRPKISVAWATAAVALTHILSAFMALCCISLAKLLIVLSDRDREAWRDLFTWCGWVLLGLMAAAFYVLPAVTTQDLINSAGWRDERWLDWRNAFIFSTWTQAEFGTRWWAFQWLLPSVGSLGPILFR
ncbi:MAG: hypothetical protein HXY24_05005 [Rubrivivax sp.]|nr:hypothetical protein [Rubrivivax sp.]